MFPNELDESDADIFSNFTDAGKQLTFVSAPTENIQARYVSDWLKQGNRIADGRQTAIILCDEHLLPTVIHCLPDEVESVNVTSGYPLSDTLVASFVMQVSQYKSATRPTNYMWRHIRRHPYFRFIGPDDFGEPTTTNLEFIVWLQQLVKRVAVGQSAEDEADQMQNESLFRMYTLLNRLRTIIESGEMEADRHILLQLIQQLINHLQQCSFLLCIMNDAFNHLVMSVNNRHNFLFVAFITRCRQFGSINQLVCKST
jgi:hypothetical protein